MQSVSACPMNETGAHTQPDKPGRMIVATRLNKFRRIGNNHTSFVVVCPFHASGDVFFLLVIYEGENETYIEASVENSSSILYDKEIRNKPRTRRTKRNV